MSKILKIRQQLWAVMVFVTFAIAVYVWTSEKADYLDKVAYAKMADHKTIDRKPIADQKFQITNFETKNTISDVELAKLNARIISNSTSLETTSEEKETTLDSRANANSGESVDMTGTSNSPGNPTDSLLDSKKKWKRAPPFRWCYDNETLDRKIDEELDCWSLFNGSHDAGKEAKAYAKSWKSPCEYTDEQIGDMASNDCALFRRSFNFLDDDVGVPTSDEERNFPLAFVLVVEKWSAQVIRMLSAAYRSQNLYCITYDLHATTAFKKAMNETMRCLRSNVLMPSEHLEIYWADISILKATVNCMGALAARRDHAWKYVQILSYNDFPLKTNEEMVRILRLFDGANDAELKEGQVERYVRYHLLSDLDTKRKNETRPVPPANLIIYKGSYAATLSRDFTNFLFENKDARDFLEWSAPTFAAEEQFWSTLIHNTHLNAPGKFPGSCLHYYNYGRTEKTWISRYQVWYDGCGGMLTSGSCVFGVGDLMDLIKQPHLVAHKFYSDFQPATLYCLTKRHYERTFVEKKHWTFAHVRLNKSYYSNLPAVRYQRMKDKKRFNCAITFKA